MSASHGQCLCTGTEVQGNRIWLFGVRSPFHAVEAKRPHRRVSLRGCPESEARVCPKFSAHFARFLAWIVGGPSLANRDQNNRNKSQRSISSKRRRAHRSPGSSDITSMEVLNSECTHRQTRPLHTSRRSSITVYPTSTDAGSALAHYKDVATKARRRLLAAPPFCRRCNTRVAHLAQDRCRPGCRLERRSVVVRNALCDGSHVDGGMPTR